MKNKIQTGRKVLLV